MPLEITRSRRQQRRITMISFGVAIGVLVLMAVFLRTTGLDQVIGRKILEFAEAITPPPPPPPPPPDVQANVKAPPPIDMNFDVQSILSRPTLDASFDLSALSNFSADMEAPNLTMEAMEFSSNDLSNMVSNAQLPVMSLMTNIGFDIGMASSEEKKASVSGSGRRTSGHTALAVLDLPGNEEGSRWVQGELESIADFISRNTSLRVQLGARAVSFLSPFNSFENWLTEARKRAPADYRELAQLETEMSGLEIMANAMHFINVGNFEQARSRLLRMLTDYMRIKWDARFSVEDTGWADLVDKVQPLREFEKRYLGRAEAAFHDFYNKRAPNGRELRDIYLMLRLFEMVQLPVLFCEPRGVMDLLLPENVRLLRAYLQNGGFIYFCNTANFNNSRAIIGLIGDLTQEQLSDPVGDKTLAQLSKDDQDVSGYIFRTPEPLIGHPRIFFPMILPRTTNVSFSVFNKFGNVVFAHTLKSIGPGAFLQKHRHFSWFCVDNQGNEVESGYYIYQMKVDLFVKTGAIGVSMLRRLPNGKHGIFSSYFNISEVPSTKTPRSEELSYGEPGVFGVSLRGRLAICFTEGYSEKDPIGSEGDPAAKEAALKWMTNVVIHALSERQLAR